VGELWVNWSRERKAAQSGVVAMPNQTAVKFGHPDTLIADYRHWCVLLRPGQVTLGSLVLVCKDEAHRFSDITAEAFGELAQVTRGIEAGLAAFRPFDKINYLMLMMVDPDVHFHVVPRYQTAQSFEAVQFPDPGWPGPPQLGTAVALDSSLRDRLIDAIKAAWPQEAQGR
jgi:diadenosine tetraphosphate (Ap4A) HIT family hydrolase